MVKPLEYGSGISLEGSRERLTEVRSEFDKVKEKYSRVNETKMAPDDLKTLGDCFGVLLKMTTIKSVQDQGLHSNDYRLTLGYQITDLTQQIGFYLSRFENSGVKAIPNPSIFD